ncbi:MAG: aldose 1-epimerase [Asticcacaulis sp.]
MLRLSLSDTVVDISPETGASIIRFTHKGRNVLRPAADEEKDALMTGNFPLVPWCNRIRDGAFTSEGRSVKLAGNHGDSPHTLHGHGWRAPWKVLESSASRAVLGYHHMPDAWPWEYEAKLIYELREDGLRCTLTCRNLSAAAMPTGLGFHPYFPRTHETRLKAKVDGVWIADEEMLPRNWHAGVLYKDWSKGDLVDHDMLIDNCYTGFTGRAEIFEGARLTHTLTSSSNCKWLHVFAPVGETFFCAEPVTHMPDPFNQPNSGLTTVKSGDSEMVWMDIAIHN